MLYYRLNYENCIYGIKADSFEEAFLKLCKEVEKDIPEKQVRISSVTKIKASE